MLKCKVCQDAETLVTKKIQDFDLNDFILRDKQQQQQQQQTKTLWLIKKDF